MNPGFARGMLSRLKLPEARPWRGLFSDRYPPWIIQQKTHFHRHIRAGTPRQGTSPTTTTTVTMPGSIPSSADSELENKAAPGIPFFTPLQNPPSGTALVQDESTPLLFRPLTIRGCTFPNRVSAATRGSLQAKNPPQTDGTALQVLVAPMCMYSAENGHMTDFHVTHLGSFAVRGAGMVMAEVTSVTPEGRISPQDTGLWEDSQIAGVKRVADMIHSQSKRFCLQIGHAGRKASSNAPWLPTTHKLAPKKHGGWADEVVGPSAIPWSDNYAHPHELSPAQIQDLIAAFVATARRAVAAGVDALQIHCAHGYLLHQFLSGVSNTRQDQYGGSFENRVRLTLEIVDALRAVIPETMPLMIRVSGSDWLDPAEFPDAWTIDQTIRFAKLLYERGVDLLDVSAAGTHPKQIVSKGTVEMNEMAGAVRKALNEVGGEAKKLVVTAIGGITSGVQAEELLKSGKADAVFAARAFLANPGFALSCADELGVEVSWPNQYLRRVRPSKA